MFGGGRCFRGGRQLSGNSLQFSNLKSKYIFSLLVAISFFVVERSMRVKLSSGSSDDM